MVQYLLDYGCFLLGCVLYLLGKIKEYKAIAEANPDPKVIHSNKKMFDKEWINLAQLIIGGVALIIFTPKLIGGVTVDIKNVSGQIVTSLAMQTILMPFYFFIGYSGNSALFAYFGKYKKTLLNQVGVDSN
jgi:hypothetical protein